MKTIALHRESNYLAASSFITTVMVRRHFLQPAHGVVGEEIVLEVSANPVIRCKGQEFLHRCIGPLSGPMQCAIQARVLYKYPAAGLHLY